MTIVKKFNGKIGNVVYHPGAREVFQGVKKGEVLKSSSGAYQQSLGNGNGEVIISAEFLVEVDLGVRDDHPERWVLVNVMPDLHRRWPRLTKRRQSALKVKKPANIGVIYHCSNDNHCYYTADSADVEQWLDAAEHYLKYGIGQTTDALDQGEDL
jgi:hypothetical protein